MRRLCRNFISEWYRLRVAAGAIRDDHEPLFRPMHLGDEQQVCDAARRRVDNRSPTAAPARRSRSRRARCPGICCAGIAAGVSTIRRSVPGGVRNANARVTPIRFFISGNRMDLWHAARRRTLSQRMLEPWGPCPSARRRSCHAPRSTRPDSWRSWFHPTLPWSSGRRFSA